MVSGVNPELENVVPVPVLEDIVLHDPELTCLSILYPVIGEPPSFAGAFHDRLIWDGETATAANPVGASGTVCAKTDSTGDIIENIVNNRTIDTLPINIRELSLITNLKTIKGNKR